MIDTDKLLKSLKKEIKKLINNEELTINVDQVEIPEKRSTTLFGQIILYFENTIISAENLFSEKKEKSVLNDFETTLFERFEKIYKNDSICFDEYTVDHLLIFAALANGVSKISTSKISLHSLTALDVIKKFAQVDFDLSSTEDTSLITIIGMNYNN
jgi:RNA 3'-terminal phosphate cyclase